MRVKKKEDNKIYFASSNERAIIPTKRAGDGCYDIYSSSDNIIINPGEIKLIPTGIHSAFSKQYRISIRERGSNTKCGLIVMAGQIDSNYRGEWFIALYNTNPKPVKITSMVEEMAETIGLILWPLKKAIAQCAVEYVPEVEVQEVALEYIQNMKTERGDGKLGSSGK